MARDRNVEALIKRDEWQQMLRDLVEHCASISVDNCWSWSPPQTETLPRRTILLGFTISRWDLWYQLKLLLMAVSIVSIMVESTAPQTETLPRRTIFLGFTISRWDLWYRLKLLLMSVSIVSIMVESTASPSLLMIFSLNFALDYSTVISRTLDFKGFVDGSTHSH